MARKDIADIRVGKRHRKELGDIAELAESIERLGLLQPVVITPDGKLIAGYRRLKACKKLERTHIDAVVAKTLTEASLRLEAERDENTCRKDFEISEAVSMGESVAKAYKPKAEAAQKKGGRSKGSTNKKGRKGLPTIKKPQDETKRTNAQAAKAAGMSRPTYEKATEVIASGDKELIAEMNRSGKVGGAYKKLKTTRAAAEIAKEPPPLPVGPFRVLVADPPWHYSKRPKDTTHRGALPYPSMENDAIAKMPVEEMAHKNAILWLWTTNAHMEHAFGIARAWGFEPKTILTWAKPKMGLGDWLRGKTEHCLMCVRGKPVVQLTNQTTLLNGPVRKHSQKPEEFYKMVERLCPGSKVELFSRQARKGWQAHGNES